MRARTLGVSLTVHLAIAFVLASLATHEPAQSTVATRIELVDAPARPAPIATDAEASLARSGASQREAPRVASRSARTRVARGGVSIDDGDPRGELRFESGGDAGSGAGVGDGTGRGRGIGLGDGARIADAAVPLVTPPAPAASKARAATLVYPARERDAEDAELFVARVTIDDEGFVVGAKLVRGFGGPRDEMAADLIWKFRYAPALDDDGRPIRSTFDQRFLVGR